MRRNFIKQNTARLLALLLCLTLFLTCAPAAHAADSGSCGDNLTWSLSAGTLTISGSGAMTNFPESTMAPWYSRREEIIRLELPGGLTRIGELAFYGCKNLTAVSIPNSVETIGQYAFAECTGLQLLTIGSGVRTIGEAAFSDCYSLKSLELPSGLTSIGTKGFYRCESISSVTVPSSVTSMGVSVFAYCKNLVSANVQASIKTLPEYMFYGCQRLTTVTLPDTTDSISKFSFRGCDNLSTVYYGGTSQTPEQIQSSIGSDAPNFGSGGFVTDTNPGGAVTSGSTLENESGTLIQENITVTPGEDSTVTTKVESLVESGGTDISGVEITVIVNGSDGWDEARETIEQELEKAVDKTDNVTVNVYVKDTNEIDSDFVDAMAGQNVTVTFTMQDGSVWKMDGSQMDSENLSGKYNLSYTLTAGTEELSTELGAQTSFFLTFAESAEVNSEVLIRIGSSWVYQEATLFQKNRDGITRIQSVVVDREGYAHFYLASVDKNTEYYIAMNLPVEGEVPIVPEELLADYGNVVNYTPVQYEITGRTSSWNMNLGQVMGILAAVMGSVIVIVGVVMYIMNKRRLKSGYVPQWDDEDYE